MNYSAAGGWLTITTTIVMFAILCLITFICFVFGQKMVKVIGRSGLSMVTWLMGLILAIIGTQLVIVGVLGASGSFLN